MADYGEEDVGNIISLEHVNVQISDQALATLFYVVGLGGTRDPYLNVGLNNMWVNVGEQRFLLPTRSPQVVRCRIGIVVPDLSNPTFQSILRDVSVAAARDGYRVLIADSSEVSSEEAILAGEARRRCDGVVLCAPRMSQDELEELAPTLHPLVLINRTTESSSTPSLVVDYGHGIQKLGAHLVELGHRRIAYLTGPERSASNVQRLRGLEKFVQDYPEVELQFIPGGNTYDAGNEASDAVASCGATGILVFNDVAAMGLLHGLSERGIRVPEDLSITGYDDMPFARYTMPGLTTAAVPIAQLGSLAWRRMREHIKHADAESPTDHFEPLLEIRGSTAPPKA